MSDELRALVDDVRERARMYAEFTSIGIPRALWSALAGEATPLPAATVRVPPAPAVKPAIQQKPAVRVPFPAIAGDPGGLAALDGVRAWAGECRRCKLAGTRTNIVFGQGKMDADLMFIGEAPGADEDEQGLAFVGRAGQLLTDIIEKGMKMSRGDVYIANILMCRPPGNRNPEPDEILSCQPFLEKKIDLIRPRVLVGLGRFPSQWLLKSEEPIGRLRGRVGEYNGIKVVPTFHPAYLLRNPSAKKDVWEDMKVVLSLLAS